MTHAEYFRRYRTALGFSNQASAKEYLSAKDITPKFDEKYASDLLERIKDLFRRVDDSIHESAKRNVDDAFFATQVDGPYNTIRNAGILPRLNNQGRRPEEVLFSWMRGFVSQEYFRTSIARVLQVEDTSVLSIGDDDLTNPQTFRRTPKADLQTIINSKACRIEVQSGFQGVNDIKEHKVREALRIRESNGIRTLCMHFDVYNGQVALVQLDTIAENDVNWVTRQQMEGQSVFAIDQNFFVWRLLEPPPSAEALELEIFS